MLSSHLRARCVFKQLGDEVKVIIMHKFHSVRMQMRVNVVMDFCIGQLEGGIDDKDVGRLNKTDPVIYRSWTLHGPKDKGFHLLFPTFYEPFIPDLFHKCRETSSVNLNTIKSIPFHTCLSCRLLATFATNFVLCNSLQAKYE